VAFGLLLCGVAAGAAADPASTVDPPPAPVASGVWAGTLPGPATAKQDGVSLRTRGDTTVRSFTLTYPAGSDSGWHAHPGIVIAVVQSGTVERQVGCEIETFSAGDSFTEVGPHDVKNVGRVPAVLSITQIFPLGDPPRLPADPPVCRPHHHR
jgi:quercetin dioxygenase-like cupin family protein